MPSASHPCSIENAGSENPAKGHWGRDILVLGLVLTVWFGAFLGTRNLSNPDEGRYTEIPREMVETGDYVTPRLNGVRYFEKPPLLYWTSAVTFEVLGQNDWTARLGVAALAVLGGLITYATARRLYGRTAGWTSAIILATMALYYGLSRVVILDLPVAVLISAALFAFLSGIQEPPGKKRRWLFWAFYASMALAVLTKGLIGFILPCAVAFVWVLLFNKNRQLWPCYPFSGTLVLLGIAAPWHILAARANADFLQFYFIHEHYERFTTTVHGRAQPWWFFIPVLLAGIFPWILFAGQSLRETLRGVWTKRTERSDIWFFIVWIVVITAFFSKSQSKLVPYILPVFPPVAVLLGHGIARFWEKGKNRGMLAGLWIFTVFMAVLALALAVAPIPEKLAYLSTPLLPWRIGLGIVCLGGAIITGWAAWSGRMRAGLLAMLGSLAVTMISANHLVDYFDTKSSKDLMLMMKPRLQPDDEFFTLGNYCQDMAPYLERFVSLVSYAEDDYTDNDIWGELSFGVNSEPNVSAGRFLRKEEFLRRWAKAPRAYALVEKKNLKRFFDPEKPAFHIIEETPRYLLIENGQN